MLQEKPAAVHGVIRSALIISFLGSVAWCISSFSYEPILAAISTGSIMLGTFSVGKARMREVLLSFLVVAAHAFVYSGLSIGPSILLYLVLLPFFELDYVYTILVFLVIGLLLGLFHGCLRSLARPPLRLFDDVASSIVRPGLIGAALGLIIPFFEGIPVLDDMNIWGQIFLRLAVLPVAFLVGAVLGVPSAIVDSYLMAEAESKPPNPGPQPDVTAGAVPRG